MSCDKNNHSWLHMDVKSVVRATAALVLATLLFSPRALAVDSGDIVVVSLKGEVHFTTNGRARDMRAGGVLAPPATLRTGRDGAVELRQGATTLSVGPETLLEFPALEKPGAPIDRIVQPRGNVFYNIGKREGRKLRIETPFLVGVVKGTQFNVAAQDGATTISLFEGLLEVRAADDSSFVDLKAGEIASRRRDDPPINVLKMGAGRNTAPVAPRPSTRNVAGSGAIPESTRVAPDTRERDAIVIDQSAAAVGVSAGIVNVQPSAPDSPGAGTGVSVSAPVVDASVGVAIDAPSTDVSLGATAGATPPAVETPAVVVAPPSIEVAVDVSVDPGSRDSGTSVIVGASPGQIEVEVGSSAAADAVAGTVNPGLEVSVGNEGLDIDVDLGLRGNGNGNGNANGYGTDNGSGNDSGNDNGNANGNGNSNGNGNGPAADVAEVLNTLVRRPGRK